MTDNNTVFKLQQAQDQLTFISQHLADIQSAMDSVKLESEKAKQRISEVLPILESASHDVSFNEPKPASQPTTALELLNAFKAAMRAPVDASAGIKLSDLTKNPSVVPQTPPVSSPLVAKPNIFGGNLTEQARQLLKSRDYLAAIEALHKMHPSAARDNIRRAVARAQGR